jgi:ribonuclease HI
MNIIEEKKIVEIYTDGACKGNPGRGGWGVVLHYNGMTKEAFGGEMLTTNNRMELTAAIEALTMLKSSCIVNLHTDSKYVQKGISEWLENWVKRNWRSSANTPVKNQDLWQKLDLLRKKHDIKWKWVKGHNGHVHNERADELANQGAASVKA